MPLKRESLKDHVPMKGLQKSTLARDPLSLEITFWETPVSVFFRHPREDAGGARGEGDLPAVPLQRLHALRVPPYAVRRPGLLGDPVGHQLRMSHPHLHCAWGDAGAADCAAS